MDALEIVLSLVVVSSIAAMLGWALFRSGRFTGRVVRQGQPIVVAVDGTNESARAVDLALGLAVEKNAKLILTNVIPVPMRFALDAPLPMLEDKANLALQSASSRAGERHIPFESRIVRDRTTAGGLVQLARDTHAGAVVVGLDGSYQRGLQDLGMVSELFRHTPCEILITREPVEMETESMPMGRLIEPTFRA